MAQYNVFAGDPGFITQDIENIKAVTKEDVIRVYNTYIKDKPFVLTSFVPKGQLDLVAENSIDADIQEESINNATQVDQAAIVEVEEIVKSPSKFDRSIEPAKGVDPDLTIPEVWTEVVPNGIKLYGIEHNELPLIQYSITMDGGHILSPACRGFNK